MLHIFRQVLFGAGNQGNHQDFKKSFQSYKCGLIFIGMKQKQKKIFLKKKKNQNGRLKKTEIFNSPNSQYFFMKISWIGPWVSRIHWCKGRWCGSTYLVVRLFDITSKMAYKLNRFCSAFCCDARNCFIILQFCPLVYSAINILQFSADWSWSCYDISDLH